MVKIFNLKKKKIQFPLNLGIWIPTCFKGNPHSLKKGVEENLDSLGI